MTRRFLRLIRPDKRCGTIIGAGFLLPEAANCGAGISGDRAQPAPALGFRGPATVTKKLQNNPQKLID
jgi:hypothetical protein